MNETRNIDEIIDCYGSRVQGVIKRFLKTPNDIEDLEQEVYIKTWKNLSRHKEKTGFWSWINTITINTCKDHLRSTRKHQIIADSEEEILENIADKALNPEKLTVMNERHKLILNGINKLNPKYKEVLMFHDIEELTYEEISRKLKCPVGTVKSRLFNARKALKEELSSLLSKEVLV